MTRVGFLLSRMRPEEKLLLQELARRGVEVDRLDDRRLNFALSGASPQPIDLSVDVVLDRCLSWIRSQSILRVLESGRQSTVNTPRVVETCGDKLRTQIALHEAQVPSPETRVAFDPASALETIEEMGYPVVIKPTIGSWGRLLARVNDRDAAEAVLEHRDVLGSFHHGVFYLQRFVEKPNRDIRAFCIGGATVAAIYRHSEHWITNTARGGSASNCELDDSLRALCDRAAAAVGGGVVAVDVVEDDELGYQVLEVNHSMEFRNSIEPTGVDIPARIVDFVLRVAEVGWADAQRSAA